MNAGCCSARKMSSNRPEGVTIHRANGDVVVCELAYVETDDEGITEWGIASEVNLAQGDSVHIDYMPAQSRITMPTQDPADLYDDQ
jgi:hypothetical protein